MSGDELVREPLKNQEGQRMGMDTRIQLSDTKDSAGWQKIIKGALGYTHYHAASGYLRKNDGSLVEKDAANKAAAAKYYQAPTSVARAGGGTYMKVKPLRRNSGVSDAIQEAARKIQDDATKEAENKVANKLTGEAAKAARKAIAGKNRVAGVIIEEAVKQGVKAVRKGWIGGNNNNEDS